MNNELLFQTGGNCRVPGWGRIRSHGRPGILRRGGKALLHVRHLYAYWSVWLSNLLSLVRPVRKPLFIGPSRWEAFVYWAVPLRSLRLLVRPVEKPSFIEPSGWEAFVYWSLQLRSLHLLVRTVEKPSFIGPSGWEACPSLIGPSVWQAHWGDLYLIICSSFYGKAFPTSSHWILSPYK